MENAPPKVWEPTERELHELGYAKKLLENPGLAARLANLLGSPIEKGFQMLPANWSHTVQRATRAALLKAVEAASLTMRRGNVFGSSELFHKIAVGAAGGIGGAFGLAALPVELPLSTTIMLRSILDIARNEGHDVSQPAVKLSALEVFALGGRTKEDDAAESGYWAVRAALAKSIADAVSILANRGLLEKTTPTVVRLVAAISARFGVVVSEQVAAKAVPVLGAAGGSLVNVLYQSFPGHGGAISS
jgi:hypothetical protein